MPTQIPSIEHAQKALIDLAVQFGPRLLAAILILIAGLYAAGWVAKVVSRWLVKLQLEPPVRMLMARIAQLVVLSLFVIMALQNLGIDLLPLIAGLGVAGAGIALAMQGVLGNLVAGLTIIFTRPFRVGEYVAMVGVEGQVDSIQLFDTRLRHTDGSVVVVPNRKIVGEILHNYGRIRQLDLRVGISRAGELEQALALIAVVVKANPRALLEPAPVIGVSVLADTSISIAVRPWVNVPDYVQACIELNRAIVDALRDGGVRYPMSIGDSLAAGVARIEDRS